MSMTIHPREYQTRMLNDTRQAIREGAQRILNVAPTGAGKTVMFAQIAQGAAARGNRVYIIVHRRELLEQTTAALYNLGVVCGQIVPGRPMTRETVQVAMVQTIVRRLHHLRRPDILIMDECHHVIEGNTFGRIIDYWSDAVVLGYTATPARLDGTGLGVGQGGYFEQMIEGPGISDLVEWGYLSYPVMYRPPEEHADNYRVKRGDFDTKEQAQAMSRRKVVGDAIEHYREHLGGLPVIVSCVNIEHARLMAEQFFRAGYTARTVWGGMPRAERERAIRGLGDGSVQVVTFCDLINEGVDVPVLTGVILMRRTMSLGLYTQIVGRSLRAYPGKRRAVILDHVGNYYLHGHILAEREWSLEGEKRDPRKAEPPQTTTCPACYGVWPGKPRTCPDCGHEFVDRPQNGRSLDFEHVQAKLVEALPEGASRDEIEAFLARASEMDPQKRQRALMGKAFELLPLGDSGKRQLDAMRRAIGYKKGWTDYAWQYAKQRKMSRR